MAHHDHGDHGLPRRKSSIEDDEEAIREVMLMQDDPMDYHAGNVPAIPAEAH